MSSAACRRNFLKHSALIGILLVITSHELHHI
ncbi:twin-arginine translocation signal domain-containing protein [Ruminococcus albus]